MADSIKANTITSTHSVLIVRNNKLVYEKYFYDYNSQILHDMRSPASGYRFLRS